jgi:ribosomal protein S3
MSILYFKKQNTFINTIDILLNEIFLEYGQKNNFLGYKIIIKGKLNKLGNVRKKKIIISNGITTLSNINYKSDFLTDTILTTTGIIGITIIINYI